MKRRSSHHRGVAMLLVLIALGTATIITTAYLASRDNSAAIGDNVTSSTAAKWAALSGIDLGTAILQTQTDWRTRRSDGKLLDDYHLGNATIDLDLIDVVTGKPPTQQSSVVRLTATATVNGLDQSATSVVTVYGDNGAGDVTVDLREFAIFADERIVLDDQATTARWSTAPMSNLGRRVAFGTRGVASGSVRLKADAAALDTTLYHGPGASGSLVDNASGTSISLVELGDHVPLPAPPAPPVDAPDGANNPDRSLLLSSETQTTDSRHDDIYLTLAQLNLVGDVTLVTDDKMIMSASKLRIDGHATVVVFNELTMNLASIELAEDATLTLFVNKLLLKGGSYIGNASASPNDISGDAPWMDPQRVSIYSIDVLDKQTWELKEYSTIKGSLYAPTDEVRLSNGAIYGRVAASEIRLQDSGAIFYDHALDDQLGYTNSQSVIFDESGNILSDFLALPSLSVGDLEAVAAATGYTVNGGAGSYADPGAGGSSGGGETDQPTLPGEPTPRPVPVEERLLSVGADVETWENLAQ